jgi:hypothetical protein
MRWVLIAVIALVGLIVVVALVGMTQPRNHTASTRAEYAKPPSEVWRVLADYERWSEWNPEIKSVKRLPDRNGHTTIEVAASWGTTPTELTVWDPPSKLRSDMNAGSFSGSWTYELSPTPNGGTVLQITEAGEVGNPLFRAMMMFHDNYETMTSFHHALAKRLGMSVTPARVE